VLSLATVFPRLSQRASHLRLRESRRLGGVDYDRIGDILAEKSAREKRLEPSNEAAQAWRCPWAGGTTNALRTSLPRGLVPRKVAIGCGRTSVGSEICARTVKTKHYAQLEKERVAGPSLVDQHSSDRSQDEKNKGTQREPLLREAKELDGAT